MKEKKSYSAAELIACTRAYMASQNELKQVNKAHHLLLLDYEPLTIKELKEYLIEIERVAICLLPYKKNHKELAKDLMNHLKKIDLFLLNKIEKEQVWKNDVSEQTEYGLIFK